MYKEDPSLQKPDNEHTPIWRYMDFPKFLNLLDKSALFFPKASKLEDPFEGTWTRTAWETFRTILPKIETELKKRGMGDIGDRTKFLRATNIVFHALTYIIGINSWHTSEYESTAMWKMYLKSNEGIAIQSTFNRLVQSLKDDPHEIYIGLVRYIDYETELALTGPTPFGQFFYKRKGFEYEKELRAIILDIPLITDVSEYLLKDGIPVQVDLDILIEKIYLAPTCPKWQFDLMESILKRYGINKEVFQSSLDDKPIKIQEVT